MSIVDELVAILWAIDLEGKTAAEYGGDEGALYRVLAQDMVTSLEQAGYEIVGMALPLAPSIS